MTETHPENRPEWQDSIYLHLRQFAQQALSRETPGHSLQPTLLVNDAYLRLLDQKNINAEDRAQVLAAGAVIIRRLLVEYARKRKALKRGGPEGRGKPLHVSVTDDANPFDALDLHDALNVLAKQNPRAAQVVEWKFFGGLTFEEIAQQLEVSVRTVKGDWRFAKAWLYRTMRTDEDPASE
ncbi:MAG: transcriptional regulator [Planctomycetales bacterium]|nr:transcriptional regulator [Planctomycetales bacterium]